MQYTPCNNQKIPDKVNLAYSGVKLTGGRLKTLFDNNISFLKRFDLDRMRYWFRVKAGKPAPGVPYGLGLNVFEGMLHGQTAAMFLMGAGTTLMWQEDATLREMMNAIVDEIEASAEDDGYFMAIEKEKFDTDEYPNYVRAWMNFGLLAAGAAGNEKAYGLVRRMGDWFNECFVLPYVKDLDLGFQGNLASTEVFRSPVGVPRDLEVAEKHYREEYWIDWLLAHDQRAIYAHLGSHPHGTLLTTLEGLLDTYRATGEEKLLNATLCALEMYKDKWQHVGGGIVMCEGELRKPGCNFLDQKHIYNELCCTTFWMLLYQRLHLLDPDNAANFDEIEQSLYNILVASQVEDRGIHYLAYLEGCKDTRWVDRATCCVGTGTRMMAMVPQLLYSYTEKEIYVNIYADSEATLGDAFIKVQSGMPYDGKVRIELAQAARPMDIKVRIPRWVDGEVEVCGIKGQPGTYLTVPACAAGTVIEFELPFGWKSTLYTGVEEIIGKERWAVEYGPLLLVAAGRDGVPVKMDPQNPKAFLDPISKNRFRLNTSTCQEYLVYMDIDDEPFFAYPVVEKPE